MWDMVGEFDRQFSNQAAQIRSGAHLNIKIPSYQYRDPHGKDKTVLRPFYL